MGKLLERKVSEHDRLLREISYSILRLEKYNEESEKFNRNFKLEMMEFKESVYRSEKFNEQFKQEMKDFKGEMKEFKINSEKDREAFHKEMKEFKREINKKWGELANKMGTIVEDIVVPNIPYIAERYFNLKDCNILQIRALKRMPSDKSKQKEFDIIAVYDDTIIYNETKETPRLQYVKEFIGFLKSNEFYKYFPEYGDKKIIPVISSLYLPENVISYLSKNNIYAMAMKEDTMDILNFEKVNCN